MDHIPRRSYALYLAREALYGLINEEESINGYPPRSSYNTQIRAEIKASSHLRLATPG